MRGWFSGVLLCWGGRVDGEFRFSGRCVVRRLHVGRHRIFF